MPPSSLAGRILRAPLRMVRPDWRMRVVSGELRGARWVAGAGTHGCWLGLYEREKARLFARLVDPGDVVYDLGANVGYYTLLAARRVGPAGRVVAFEPLPRNLAYLREHVALNRAANVDVLPYAVSDVEGEARFAAAESPSMGALREDGGIPVQVVALDAMAARGELPRAPTFLKIDIEGAEAGALAGATRILATRQPTILLAVHGDEQSRLCRETLAKCGYALHALDAPSIDAAAELLAVRPGSEAARRAAKLIPGAARAA